MKNLLFIVFLCSLALGLFPTAVNAQEPISSGIATYVTVKGDVQTGDIVHTSTKGYQKTAMAYDPTMFGVITDNPSVSLEDTTNPDAKPVISRGKVYVRVSTINGAIKQGDLITSSNIPGVGQKATTEGYFLGTAVEDYDAKDTKAVGSILVILNISFNQEGVKGVPGNIFQTLIQGIKAPYTTPLSAFKYIMAGLLIITSFIVGVSFFGKISSLGVAAIGRNPLASKAILAGVILHVFLAGVIILAGVVLAYFILVL